MERDVLRVIGDEEGWTPATQISLLATGERPSLDVGSLHPGLRTGRIEHHHVFWLPRKAEPALLHERMGLITRLSGRHG